ncbi:hypothetical protein LCGC14_2923270, partial [marine sediment metagenome]
TAGSIEGFSSGWSTDAPNPPLIPTDQPIVGIAATTTVATTGYQYTFLTIAA